MYRIQLFFSFLHFLQVFPALSIQFLGIFKHICHPQSFKGRVMLKTTMRQHLLPSPTTLRNISCETSPVWEVSPFLVSLDPNLCVDCEIEMCHHLPRGMAVETNKQTNKLAPSPLMPVIPCFEYVGVPRACTHPACEISPQLNQTDKIYTRTRNRRRHTYNFLPTKITTDWNGNEQRLEWKTIM